MIMGFAWPVVAVWAAVHFVPRHQWKLRALVLVVGMAWVANRA